MYGLGILRVRGTRRVKGKKMHKKRVKRTEQKRKGWKGKGNQKEGRLRTIRKAVFVILVPINSCLRQMSVP